LKTYDIDVGTRESAAAAIDYLYENEPDAIFMDFEMPGMDGFQALKVIKSNPHTAVIPVMMYTSKEGGLAVSQARALGAVGVLPKQLEAKDLEDVLHSLHLMPEQESLVHGFHDEDLRRDARSHRTDNVHPIHGGNRVLNEPVETVSLPLESYQQELSGSDSVKRSVRREITQAEERIQTNLDRHYTELHAELFEIVAREEETAIEMHRIKTASWFSALISMVLLGALFYLLFGVGGTDGESQGVWQSEFRDQMQLQSERLDQIEDQLGLLSLSGPQDLATTALPLSLLEWSANQSSGFGFNELPYGDERALWLSEFVEQLKQAGFSGVIELRAHYGNFCLTKTDGDLLSLADPRTPVSECLFAADVKGGEAWRNEQSVAFANYLNLELTRSGGEVEILLFSSGFNDPQVPQPPVYEVKSAGDWNQIARQNQRVKVSLYSNP
jgi:CheY-like chemotaxis protein